MSPDADGACGAVWHPRIAANEFGGTGRGERGTRRVRKSRRRRASAEEAAGEQGRERRVPRVIRRPKTPAGPAGHQEQRDGGRRGFRDQERRDARRFGSVAGTSADADVALSDTQRDTPRPVVLRTWWIEPDGVRVPRSRPSYTGEIDPLRSQHHRPGGVLLRGAQCNIRVSGCASNTAEPPRVSSLLIAEPLPWGVSLLLIAEPAPSPVLLLRMPSGPRRGLRSPDDAGYPPRVLALPPLLLRKRASGATSAPVAFPFRRAPSPQIRSPRFADARRRRRRRPHPDPRLVPQSPVKRRARYSLPPSATPTSPSSTAPS